MPKQQKVNVLQLIMKRYIKSKWNIEYIGRCLCARMGFLHSGKLQFEIKRLNGKAIGSMLFTNSFIYIPKWSVIYFQNHFINVAVDWMENTRILACFRRHFDWNRIFRSLFSFILFPFGWNFCANFNCDLSLYSLTNCNIWRMNNVMHERTKENESKKEREKFNTIVNSLRNQIKFNIERPHATYISNGLIQQNKSKLNTLWILHERMLMLMLVCACASHGTRACLPRKQKENSYVKRFNQFSKISRKKQAEEIK